MLAFAFMSYANMACVFTSISMLRIVHYNARVYIYDIAKR